MKKEDFTAQEMQRKIAEIAHAQGLYIAVLYGSVARGTATSGSDIDIGVLGTTALSHEDEAVIAEKIARASGAANIEVRSLHHASPLFLNEVMDEGIVLFADTPVRAQALRLYAWKMAAETKPLRDARFAQTKERIEAYAG